MRRVIAVLLALALSMHATVGRADGGAAGPSRSLAQGRTLHGKFVQERRLQGFKAPLRSEGQFMLAPGRGLIWQSEKPFPVTTVITAAGLVQDVGGMETMRMPAARLPFLAKLYDMLGGALTGDWRALEREFTIIRQGDDRAWQVELQPRTVTDPMSMPIRVIRISGGHFVDRVEIVKDGGDADTLEFGEQTLSDAPSSEAENALLTSVGK